MDSLLANYASSDDDEERQDNQQPPQRNNLSESLQPLKTPSSSSSSLISSLPKPQSSSLFSSLPPPKSQLSGPQTTSSSTPTSQNHGQTIRVEKEEKGLHGDSISGSKFSSGLFTSLPAPKSQPNSVPISSSSGSGTTSLKKVVQFRPPVIQSSFKSDDKDDDDDNDDEYIDKKKSQVINPSSSFKSFISSMPAPTNSATLGTLSGSGGSGRRAIVETSAPSISSDVYKAEEQVGNDAQISSHDSSFPASLGAGEGQYNPGGDVTNWGQSSESYAGYESYESYGNSEGYANYASYENGGQYDQNSWVNTPSTWVAPEASSAGIIESMGRVSGKRGRNQIPTEIVEVSQDELMKNRPRQDQVKLTGIAFGPAYQPVPSGGGNKPTKLHKRKHQIGSLYFDMRQKEMELSERRAKGMLTKAETQAKYGW